MADVIDALYRKSLKAEFKAECESYDARWDRAYEQIKQGGVVPYYEAGTRDDYLEAQRNIMGRLIRDVKTLQDEVAALKKMKEERND